MKALVTGSEGFIGQNIVSMLKDEGFFVVGVDKANEKKSQIDEFITENVLSKSLYIKLAKFDFDYVFHFGTPSSIILFNEDEEKCYTETVISQMYMLRLLEQIKPKKYIFPSSSSLYAGVADGVQSEDRYPVPLNSYAAAKMAVEGLASKSLYKNWLALRVFAGYGEGEEEKGKFASPVYHFLKCFVDDTIPEIWGDGNQSRDFVHIQDIINVIHIFMKNDVVGILNVGTGRNITFNETLDIMKKITGKEKEIKYVSKPKNYVQKLSSDISKLKNYYNAFITIEDGIKRFYDHLMKVN